MGGVPREQIRNKTPSEAKGRQAKINTNAIEGIGKDKKPAQYWQNIVNNLKDNRQMILYTYLSETNAIEMDDMTVGIQFPKGIDSAKKSILERPENVSEISKQVSIACGKEMRIKYIDTKPQVQGVNEEQELSNFANGFDIPFNVIE